MDIKYRTEFGKLLEHLNLKGDACECGVAEARNAQVLIASPQIEKLYLIDNWATLNQSGDGSYAQEWHDNNWKEAHERVEPWKEKAVFLKGLSHKMIVEIPHESLIFAYIDGDHSFRGCYSDLVDIETKVKPGGIIALHDVMNPHYGVAHALRQWIEEYGYSPSDVHYTEEDGDLSMVSAWIVKK